MLTPPLKWHGGKQYLARKIVAMMPPHLHYVEPYAGGLAVLLAKEPEGVSEVVNDINTELTNFWNVLREPDLFYQLQRAVEATPFSEADWKAAGRILPAKVDDKAMQAWAFFVRCRQSLAGRMDCFAPLSRTRTRRNMNEQASAWLNAIEGLPEVHARLKRVVILNHDALDVIRQQDGPQTLFYLDPPYLHETRVSRDSYAHEMSNEDHERLMQVLINIKGKFILSGYRSELYDDIATAEGWVRREFTIPNHAASGTNKRRMIECCWSNFLPTETSTDAIATGTA